MITVTPNSLFCPSYNEIISVLDVTEESGLSEPVAVQEVKDYLRTEGWSGEESEATEFTFDDGLIAELIAGFRQYIEQVANVSLIPHLFEVVLTNGMSIELPFSPISEITSVIDQDGNAVDNDLIKVIGNNRKRLLSPTGYNLTVSYATSVLIDSRPSVDIKRLVAAMYDNRGMDVATAATQVNLLISFLFTKKSNWMNLPIKLVKNVVAQGASGEWGESTVTKYQMFAELVQPSSAFRNYDAQTQLGQVKTFRIRFNFDLHPTGDWKIEFRGKLWTVQGMPLKDDRQFYWLVTANYKG